MYDTDGLAGVDHNVTDNDRLGSVLRSRTN